MKAQLEQARKEILDDQNVIQNLDWLRSNLDEFNLDAEGRKKFDAALDELAERYTQSKGTDFFTTLLNSTFRDLRLALDDEKV